MTRWPVRAVDLFEKEPLKGNSEVHLHTPTKFGEDRSKDLGGDREQTDRQTNRQTDKRCSIYSMILDQSTCELFTEASAINFLLLWYACLYVPYCTVVLHLVFCISYHFVFPFPVYLNSLWYIFSPQPVPPTARPAPYTDSAQQPAALTVMHTTVRQSCATAAPTSVRPAHTAAVPGSAARAWTGTRSVLMPRDAHVIYHLISYFKVKRYTKNRSINFFSPEKDIHELYWLLKLQRSWLWRFVAMET